MKIFNEITLKNFRAWSGAIDTKKRIIKEKKDEDFDILIEDIYPDGLEEVKLNDILWFDKEWIFEMLGIKEN